MQMRELDEVILYPQIFLAEDLHDELHFFLIIEAGGYEETESPIPASFDVRS